MTFEELKERQGVVWGSGPFEVVAETIADVHRAVIEAVGDARGKRWLDVACRTGGVTELAAAAGRRRRRDVPDDDALPAAASRRCGGAARLGSRGVRRGAARRRVRPLVRDPDVDRLE